MRRRCGDPKAVNYGRYGGAGIRVCERWQASFEAFFSDMGEPPTERHSIDRINGLEGYSRDNCRWATTREQRLNRARQHD